MFVHELILRGARDDIAIKESGHAITYRELQAKTAAARDHLYDLGVRKGDNVALFSRNSSLYIIASMAIASLGAVAVPINFQLSPREMAFILNDAEAHFLLSDRAVDLAPALKAIGYTASLHVTLLSDLIAAGSSFPPAPVVAMQDTDPYIIIYTSGTTGTPKGAVLSHKNVTTNSAQFIERSTMDHHDNVLCVLPMYHCFGWTMAVLAPLYAGAAITVLANFQPKETLQTIRQCQVTIIEGVPSIISLIARLGTTEDMATVRVSISGGTPLPEIISRTFAAKFQQKPVEAYGLSEASPLVSLNPPGQERFLSIGLPLKGVETRIVDTDGHDVPPGRNGELIVRGDTIMLGYWHRPEATAEAIQDGWLHTSDVAHYDDDGYIYIVDRLKDMIISMGENIYPREIEELIYQFPGIEEAAVIGVPDKIRGQAGSCFYSAKKGETVDKRALKKYLRENLALYKIPREFHELASLPRTATGKIAKRKLLPTP
jgi:long-chain acyl-CoA synthetase